MWHKKKNSDNEELIVTNDAVERNCRTIMKKATGLCRGKRRVGSGTGTFGLHERRPQRRQEEKKRFARWTKNRS